MTALATKEKTLSKEIVILLVVKLCAITAIWYAFYRDPVIPSMIDGMDPAHVSQAVLKQSGNTQTGSPSANTAPFSSN